MPFPATGDLPNPGINPGTERGFPTSQAYYLSSEPSKKPLKEKRKKKEKQQQKKPLRAQVPGTGEKQLFKIQNYTLTLKDYVIVS